MFHPSGLGFPTSYILSGLIAIVKAWDSIKPKRNPFVIPQGLRRLVGNPSGGIGIEPRFPTKKRDIVSEDNPIHDCLVG